MGGFSRQIGDPLVATSRADEEDLADAASWEVASQAQPCPRPAAAPERLHIAFVSDCFDGALGGGMVSAARVVGALRERHEVVVLSADTRAEPGHVALPGFQLPLHAMKAMRFRMAVPRRESFERVFSDVDVVHLQLPFWVSFGALAAARRLGVPVVAAFHVQPENLLLNIGVRSPRISRALYRFWVRRYYGRADAVVCPSRFARDKLLEHGLETPVHVVSNGVPPWLRRREAAREPRHHGYFLVLMVGRLATEKHQELMLQALARAKHAERVRLVIAGAGPREAELRRAAAALPHPPEIGYVSNERLERLYNSADLLVHCSEVELEGMAVLEALSCGLPALVANSPDSAATQFALGPEFLFRSGSAGDLAARIDWHVEHQSALAAARARAIRAAQAFRFEDCVERLEEAYRGAIRARHPGGRRAAE